MSGSALSLRAGFALAAMALGLNVVGLVPAPVGRADMAELPPNWAGTWRSGGMESPASVTLSSTTPLVGEIDSPGVCHATWTEVARPSATNRIVAAHVTSGPCVDNTWTVTLSLTHLDGTDTTHPDTTFALMPNGIDPRTGQPASVEPTCAESLPLDQMPPGSEAALERGGALPKNFSTGMYGACALIDAQGPGGINEPGVADGVCKGIESFMDPLNLGYSKDVVCGTSAH